MIRVISAGDSAKLLRAQTRSMKVNEVPWATLTGEAGVTESFAQYPDAAIVVVSRLGGEPGMNHKGLVTFDRKIKKDAFYLYKAWWSTEPFVYIAGRRFVDRPNAKSTVTVYSNQPEVTLYINGKKHQTLTGGKVFRFPITVSGEMKIEAVAGALHDIISIRKVAKPNPDYKLGKDAGNAGDWV